MTRNLQRPVSREAAEAAIALRKTSRNTSWDEAVRRSTRRVGRWEERGGPSDNGVASEPVRESEDLPH